MGGLDYIINRTGLWIDLGAVLAIVAFIVSIIYFILKRRSLIKKEEELEELLEAKYQRESEQDVEYDAEQQD